MAELHQLTPFRGSRKKAKRIGRGLGSGHGAYSTRGVKGQRARSGGSHGLKARGMKQIVLRIPKLGGFRSIHEKSKGVNLSRIEEQFTLGETVSPRTLVRKGIIKSPKSGKLVDVKILGDGTLTKPLTFKDCSVSATAKEKIEKAGGTVC
ncbi:MAG: 50S ribosomal protein L15 [Patescibacteria group bacterium]